MPVACARALLAHSFADTLIVNGLTYCGNTGPQGEYITAGSYNADIMFSSDWAISHSGFAVCMIDDPPPTFSPTTAAPTTPPTPAPSMGCDTATGFTVTSGSCTACGDCFHTPNYLVGQDYHNSHSCTIAPLYDGWLDVVDFQIEDSWWSHCAYDGLVVDGVTYCGTVGPQGAYVTTSSSISFYSDYIIAMDGAYICLSPTFTSTLPPPTSSPTIPCDTPTHFSVTSGGCHACGNCFHSPNYLAGGDYDDNHACTIDVLQSGWLDVLEFDVEDSSWSHCPYDGLVVDGVTYC